MKILLVCTYFPPHVGGLEVVVQQQAESLARAGHNVRVLTTDLSVQREESRQGYTVIRVHTNNYTSNILITHLIWVAWKIVNRR